MESLVTNDFLAARFAEQNARLDTRFAELDVKVGSNRRISIWTQATIHQARHSLVSEIHYSVNFERYKVKKKVEMTQAPENHAREMRQRVYRHMLETRGWKYREFLRYLRFFKYASFSPTRGEFLESYYTLMRYLDDVVDGDVPLPYGFRDGVEYMNEKISFSKNPVNPKDEVDFLMEHCSEVAGRFAENFESETEDILNSLLFDARRRGRLTFFPEAELDHHFHLLDVRGTIRATLKVFKDDPEKYKLLEPLGMASRYQYDLEDFDGDIQAGYVNISIEESRQFGISAADLQNKKSPGVTKWFRHRAGKGLALLDEHHRRLPEGKFSFLQRLAFPLVYENPARNVFDKVLSGQLDFG